MMTTWPMLHLAKFMILWLLFCLQAEAKSLWSRKPAGINSILKEAFPVGNGRLGAMPFGQPGQEKINMNIDTLWSGGPFESTSYNGGNPPTFRFQHLQEIRNFIFETGTGNVSELLGSNNHYGTFRVLANISVSLEGINSYNNYNRSLDLTTGIHTTTFMGNDYNTYTSVVYCSSPAKVCVYRLTSSGNLPNVAVTVENRLVPGNLFKTSCGSSQLRLTGVTQESNPVGMEYDMLVRLSTGPLGMPMSSCSTSHNGTLVVSGSAYGKDMPLNTFAMVIGATTDYDATKGNANDQYSFKGTGKTGFNLERATAQMSTRLESKLVVAHTQDYQRLMNEFRMELYDPWRNTRYPSESLEISQLLDRYKFTAGMSNTGKRKRSVEEENIQQRMGKSNEKLKSSRVAQFAPKPPNQSTWNSASQGSATEFPKFPYPTQLAAGSTPTGPVPWSTDGVVTATGHDGKTHTLTLTKSTTLSATQVMESETVPTEVKVDNSRAEAEALGTTEQLNYAEDPTSAQGDPYVEALLFEYAKHLYISSTREDSLPPNLQGVWEDDIEAAWSGDYHANINLQMSHWFVDQVGLGSLQNSLWNYIEQTWVPRGTETARLLYNGIGWVTHDEMNIFGHTSMKNSASWGNYPMAAAWMMQHVFDHWDYSRDVGWLQKQGYNLVRGAAQFWTTQLVRDRWTQDNSLVVNPCNSPERDPTTFGCTNWQQLLHQLFTQALVLSEAVNDADVAFTSTLNAFLLSIDKGIHYTSWGGLKEFKLSEGNGLDVQGDKGRHLSHLVGWYPGYSIASFSGGFSNATIQNAVAQSLRSRGNGYAEGNAGWAKVWRAAAWARLNDTDQADYHLRFTIFSNIGAGNALSIYDGKDGPFQIDTNFGIAGAMLSMLIVDLPQSYPKQGKRSVVLGPAIPSRWGPGSVKGLRVRGGTILDMNWNNRGVVDKVAVTKRGESCRFYSKEGKVIGEI